MAAAALKAISKEALLEAHRVSTLSCLLATQEGRNFFQAFLVDPTHPHPEFAKYYSFYCATEDLAQSELSPEKQLDLAETIYHTYIAIEASHETRVDSILNRLKVNEIKKALREAKVDPVSIHKIYKDLQCESYEFLDQNIFRTQVIPILKAEKKSRVTCVIN